VSLQHHHEYAVDLPRSLPDGFEIPAREFPASLAGAHSTRPRSARFRAVASACLLRPSRGESDAGYGSGRKLWSRARTGSSLPDRLSYSSSPASILSTKTQASTPMILEMLVATGLWDRPKSYAANTRDARTFPK
jgi:hypothetical protein